jgi:hypothetical protein
MQDEGGGSHDAGKSARSKGDCVIDGGFRRTAMLPVTLQGLSLPGFLNRTRRWRRRAGTDKPCPYNSFLAIVVARRLGIPIESRHCNSNPRHRTPRETGRLLKMPEILHQFPISARSSCLRGGIDSPGSRRMVDIAMFRNSETRRQLRALLRARLRLARSGLPFRRGP